MQTRIVIIEDEPVNARNLAFLLSEIDENCTVVKTLASVKESVNWLPNNIEEVDLLFMDIRLSDGVSFDILNAIKIEKPIIFATAYEEYALKAFSANSIAYILKPYDKDELATALNEFKLYTAKSADMVSQETLKMVLSQIQHQPKNKNTFLFHYQNKLIPVNAVDIAWFYSKNEITRACTKDGKLYFVDNTLEHLIDVLDDTMFFRANRQFIVNKNAIELLDFYFNGRLLVKVNPVTEEQVIVSKAKATSFKNWLDS